MYIPQGCVTSSNKFRIVFDCSAKAFNVSFNDKLLQGPQLTNSLMGVFLRFRQEPIAEVGDIKSMFHQVFVAEEDRDALGFLWFSGGDLESDPVVFRMNVRLFGSTSSPSVAAFALLRTAENNAAKAESELAATVNPICTEGGASLPPSQSF